MLIIQQYVYCLVLYFCDYFGRRCFEHAHCEISVRTLLYLMYVFVFGSDEFVDVFKKWIRSTYSALPIGCFLRDLMNQRLPIRWPMYQSLDCDLRVHCLAE
jgi:hypothetical protein